MLVGTVLVAGFPAAAFHSQTGRSIRARLLQVRGLPLHRGDPVADPHWAALKQEGAALAPELVDLVGDGTPMADPRPEARWTQFAVGDLALILLVELGQVDFEAVVVPLVGAEAYGRHGAVAYANWVLQEGNRPRLVAAVRRAWAERTAPPQSRPR
jgi:hypothetical protein